MLYIIYALLIDVFSQSSHMIAMRELREGMDERPIQPEIDVLDILRIHNKYNQWKYLEEHRVEYEKMPIENVKKDTLVNELLGTDDIRGFQLGAGGLMDDWLR